MMSRRTPRSGEFRNAILFSLPADELEALRPFLSHMHLTPGLVVQEAADPFWNAYFVEDGLLSLVGGYGNEAVQVGLIGSEGVSGLPAFLSPYAAATYRAVVTVPGNAYRIRTPEFRSAMDRLPNLRLRCLQYAEKLLSDTAQLVICNCLHSLPERLARTLLVVSDTLDTDSLPVTHTLLSTMLGVRRAGITVAANRLQKLGFIRLLRGSILLVDHDGLASISCACYRSRRQNSPSHSVLTEEEADLTVAA